MDKNVSCKFIRILAIGCSKSYGLLEIDGFKLQWVFISRELYFYLKSLGVQTSQSRRWHKDD